MLEPIGGSAAGSRLHQVVRLDAFLEAFGCIGAIASGLVFEGAAWLVAFRASQRERGDHTLLQAVRSSKDPTVSPYCSKTLPRCSATGCAFRRVSVSSSEHACA